ISKQITLIDGVKEILEHFKKQNLKIGLISNSSFPTEFHIEELKNYDIIHFFEETLFSYDFGLRKPHPDLFKHVLNKLELKPQETVFIGDRLIEDVSGPQKVGMKAILKYKKERDYSAPVVPDYVVNNLSELPEVIRKFK
ncbi:MAG TPA: HAD family hydrolase, partial [candidate division Zixibacteria bacterium]|nr:HAD family hydrolase [candidate division Zixibacteria bacterium]